MKHPFLKFYVRDWQSDFELRMCSLEARGLWLECLCIMHNAKRRGFMETPQGQALTIDHMATLMGTDKGRVKACKDELSLHGVFSVEENKGIMYSRRMVKDEEKFQKASAWGKKAHSSSKRNTRRHQTPYKPEATLKATLEGKKEIIAVIDHLNTVLGAKYKYKAIPTVRCITARLNEDYTVEDFKKVIDRKALQWKGTEHEKYLRPETLFGNKFEGYLQERQTAKVAGKTVIPHQSSPAQMDEFTKTINAQKARHKAKEDAKRLQSEQDGESV